MNVREKIARIIRDYRPSENTPGDTALAILMIPEIAAALRQRQAINDEPLLWSDHDHLLARLRKIGDSE